MQGKFAFGGLMDFLGIGPMELLFIVVIAFIVLGPQRLKDTAHAIGKLFSEVKSRTDDARSSIEGSMEDNDTTETLRSDPSGKKPMSH